MNQEPVFRTAPAAPGLLITDYVGTNGVPLIVARWKSFLTDALFCFTEALDLPDHKYALFFLFLY